MISGETGGDGRASHRHDREEGKGLKSQAVGPPLGFGFFARRRWIAPSVGITAVVFRVPAQRPPGRKLRIE